MPATRQARKENPGVLARGKHAVPERKVSAAMSLYMEPLLGKSQQRGE